MIKNSHVDDSVSNNIFLPDIADIYSYAYKVIDELPVTLKNEAEKLVIRVENFAPVSLLSSLNLQNKYDLLGLYQGIPLHERDEDHLSILENMDLIYLFRCPLIRYANENKEDVHPLIKHVILHEIAHHMGFNEIELYCLEAADDGPWQNKPS